MDYIEAFKNLKTNNKFSRKSPHKAVLLLTIIDMYESCMLSENVIRYDNLLKETFVKIWNKVLPNENVFLPETCFPFWFMQNEDFWHVVPIRGKEDILSLLNDTNVKPSESKLRDCVDYVELDEDLYFLMTLRSGRSSLKRALLETYTALSNKTIDIMSESSDNFVDNSLSAILEYKNMLSSANSKTSGSNSLADKNIINRFNVLSEDIQYTFFLAYYSFLKNHKNERDMFKEVCPTVYDLYDKISENPLQQGDVTPSLSFIFEDFLTDLKFSLMSEDDSFALVDSINQVLDSLKDQENTQSFNDFGQISDFEEKEHEDVIESVSTEINNEEISEELTDKDTTTSESKRPALPIAKEDRIGRAWSSNEEELISLYFNQGYSVLDIANAMGRSEISVKLRLAQFGLIDKASLKEDIKLSEVSYDDSKPLDFYVENSPVGCSIFNRIGEKVFTTNGKFKIFNGKPYRFNYKDKVFTVKDMVRNGEEWEKGTKKLVALTNSDLYPLLKKDEFIDQIEDFVEGSTMELNTICIDGKWYDFYGGFIKNANPSEKILDFEDSSEYDSNLDSASEYVPKGKLKRIKDVAKSPHDYLWLIAIVDFMAERHSNTLSYDELACMMLANAWEILYKKPSLKDSESSIVECVDFLIEESKHYMDEILEWSSPKDKVFNLIKDYPMAGVFEDTIDEMLESSPIRILKAWIKTDDENDLVMFSMGYKNSCLYAVHPRKIDPYIEINPNWKHYLYNDYHELIQYFTEYYLLSLNHK